MIRDGSDRLMASLEDLLDAERQILLAGELVAVGPLTRQKERLLDNPALAAADQPTLERIRAKANRNGELLGAAIRGVQAAAARLDALRQAPRATDTYDRSGQRKTLGQGDAGAWEHKA